MKFGALVEERRALALAVLAFYASVLLIVALAAPPPWRPLMWSLMACYGVAFMALASEWFWGRWFALGIAWNGVMSSLFALLGGLSTLDVVIGLTHGVVVLALFGRRVAARYELRLDVQSRFGLDEAGVNRVGKTVTRVASTLPTLLALVLAPRDAGRALELVALGCGLLAFWGLLCGRTWGLAATAGSLVAVLASAGDFCLPATSDLLFTAPAITLGGYVVALLLASAIAPFARPLWAALRSPRP